jgi:predicted metal-dependent phosphoesterase TrpH
MSIGRRAASAALLCGVALGTFVDGTVTRRPPSRENGYWILAGDFHVHAFFGDGALPPWAIRREAERRGLDVVAITNHNQTLTARFGRWLSRRLDGPLLLVADEVTTASAHVVAAGIERSVDPRLPLPEIIDAIHAQGGVAIAAHPVRGVWSAYTDAAMRKLDGAEIAHPIIYYARDSRVALPAFYARARALRRDLAPIGSSDFHAFAPMGWCRTYVLASDASEAGVLDAIRRGRTVAVDGDGHAHGDLAWVDLVRRSLGSRPAAATPDHRRWDTVAAALAWGGLLGIVLFDDRPRSRQASG